ncbi:OprD family outer membrane porin [Vibrio sonorensis]|uniref:OprD family outer membrane porin n=1 Tax=Vibrio sonorensis TaxID=1004316 RepID=UPI0008DAEF44|nr:OprD family outer membrane porin [Vibrio sonorensis]
MKHRITLSLLSASVLAALASGHAVADNLDPNDVLNESVAAVDLATEAKQAFYDSSSSKIHSFLYIRDREEKDANGTWGPQIENQTLQLAWDYKSGYFRDTVGLDIWANTNIQLGSTTGMSEILYYDHSCENNPAYDGKGCEKSYAAVPIMALKTKFGDDEAGLAVRAGHTRINIGTIRSGWGLNPHAYQGLEAKAHYGDFVFGYAVANKFKNDWRKEFLPMTTKWHQNQKSGVDTTNTQIDYIHTLGAIYKFDNGQIDLGYGEGKDYRTNWQALGKYGFNLGDAKVNLTAFYHGSKAEETELTEVTNAKKQRYLALGANIKHGGFTWTAGLSDTDTGGQELNYNFRLTPWANSDNRHFQQTTSGLDDYNTDGTRAFKLGMKYNFASWELPELTVGVGGNYGTNVRSDKKEREYDGEMHSFDWNVGYKFLDGALEGLNARVYRAKFRGDNIVHKKDRNDTKVLISYSIPLK